jgi:hypothetical protein
VRTQIAEITNNEATAVRVRAELWDVRMEQDGTLISYRKEAGDATGVENWLTMRKRRFTLFPGETRKVQYAVAVPRDKGIESDLVGMIRFEARELDVVERKSGPDVIGETGVLALVTTAGEGKACAEVGMPTVSVKPELGNEIRLFVPIRNTGKTHFFAKGTVEVVGISQPAFFWERPLVQAREAPLVLPESERFVSVTLPRQVFLPGEYEGKITLFHGAAKSTMRTFGMNLFAAPDLLDAADSKRGEDDSGRESAQDDEKGKRQQ